MQAIVERGSGKSQWVDELSKPGTAFNIVKSLVRPFTPRVDAEGMMLVV